MLDRTIAREIKSAYWKEIKSDKNMAEIQATILIDYGLKVSINTLYGWRHQAKKARKLKSNEPSIRLLKAAIHALAVAVDEICCDLADKKHPAITALKEYNWQYFHHSLKGPKRQGS